MAELNVNRAEFVRSAASPEAFIRDSLPRIVFAGKSNVGKSSVINRLLNRKNFARVGSQPGKTIHVNYFKIDGRCWFVDLPGYGYAAVAKAERDRWARLMESFFAEPEQISLGVLIVDARHRPTADDLTMAEWFKGSGRPFAGEGRGPSGAHGQNTGAAVNGAGWAACPSRSCNSPTGLV